jgi:hypothetical protein
MTKDQAIHRIRIAISELRRVCGSQGALGDGTPEGAIRMLEEVVEAIQKDQLEHKTPHAA